MHTQRVWVKQLNSEILVIMFLFLSFHQGARLYVLRISDVLILKKKIDQNFGVVGMSALVC